MLQVIFVNEVATGDNGVITAQSPGTAVIFVESETNRTATCIVTVKAPVTELSFEKRTHIRAGIYAKT